MFLVNSPFKKSVIFVFAAVYMLFACGYVLLCQRDTRTVNLLDCFHRQTPAANLTALTKGAPKPATAKFGIRPRVITNKKATTNFSSIIITFFLLFSFFLPNLFLTPFVKKRLIIIFIPGYFFIVPGVSDSSCSLI